MATLAHFERRRFATIVRRRLTEAGRGYRALAGEIGVTASDLSRIVSAQPIAVEKAIAVSRWAGLALDDFYIPPQEERETFHVAGTETVAREVPA